MWAINQVPPPALRDSAWSWWTRPRAVSYGGVVYVGGVDRGGRPFVDEWPDVTTVRTRHILSDLSRDRDDHNNPALILEPGKPPIMFYSTHGGRLRYRRGLSNFVAGADLGEFDTEVQLIGSPVTGGTYAAAHQHGDDLHVWARGGSTFWRFTKSTDWGLNWTAPAQVFESDNQFYTATVLRGDTLRCAMSTHPKNASPPDQNIYYAEIDLVSGDVSAGGSVLGNLDGTNLPIRWDACEVVASPSGGLVTWVYDVSDGPDPEVAWVQFDLADIAGTSMYRYSVKDGAWSHHDVVAAGDAFPSGAEPYLGGTQFPRETAGGVLYVSRESAGIWHVERLTTDGGSSWATESVLTDTAPAVRAWPVEVRDGTSAPFEVAVNFAQGFVDYDYFYGNVGGSRLTG